MKKGVEFEWKRVIVQKLTSSLSANIGDISALLYYTVISDCIKGIKISNQYEDMMSLAKTDKVPNEFRELMAEIADVCECDNQTNRRARFLYNLKVLYNEFGDCMPKCITDWKDLAKYLLICAVKLDSDNDDSKRISYLTEYFISLFKIKYSKEYISILKRYTLCGVNESLNLANGINNVSEEVNVVYSGGYEYEQ